MKLRIVTEKKGWILHRMAEEIARHLPGTRINRRWRDADIHYFINYGYFKPVRGHGLTVANFTHYDPDHLAESFMETAQAVDHCIAISESTKQHMIERGVPADKITTIIIGADVRYRPRVTVGIVGRTYAGGRKGEHLVAALLDDEELMDGLHIVANQEGWGVPVRKMTSLQEFYESIDLLLVPALLEGGPVPFMEALACGVPAVAPSIGVIPRFPHIEYRTGDIADCKRVLAAEKERLLSRRRHYAKPIFPYTWKRWAKEHIELFEHMLASGERG